MATCPVRFEFYCGEEELKYIHNIPESLVTVGAHAAQNDAGYANLFVNVQPPVSPFRMRSAKIAARRE